MDDLHDDSLQDRSIDWGLFEVLPDSTDQVFFANGNEPTHMDLDVTNSGCESGEGPETDEFETSPSLQKTTDKQRANLIADVVGHPEGTPSVAELDYMNPSLEEDAIRRYLGILQDIGVVEELVVEPGHRVRGYPYKFYTLTATARELFDRNDLFPTEAWQRQYDRVQKTAEDSGARRDAASG